MDRYKAIRDKFKEDYEEAKGKGGYRIVGKIWNVSAGLAWDMIDDDNYWPKDKEIQRIIIEKAKQRGIDFSLNGRRRQRVEIDPDISDEELKLIRRMTVAERTKILRRVIKGE